MSFSDLAQLSGFLIISLHSLKLACISIKWAEIFINEIRLWEV